MPVRFPRRPAPALPRTPFALAAALAVGAAPMLTAAAPLTIAAPSAPVVVPSAPTSRTPLPTPDVEAPTPDVLSVDVEASSTAETAQGRAATVFGAEPTIAEDEALGRDVVSFDGTNAIRYDFADGFERTEKAVTIECTVRFDGGLTDSTGEDTGNFCGAKEAGGYSLTVYGSTLKMMVNVDGTYYGAGAEVREGVWYHVTGVWDGDTVRLYLNGEKVAEEPTTAGSIQPPKEPARQFFLGADTDGSGNPQFHGTASVSEAAIHSTALSDEQITARYVSALSDRTDAEVAVQPVSPAADTTLTTATPLAVDVENAQLLAGPLELAVDGEPVEPVELGDAVGPGLGAGEHTLSWSGVDAFGTDVSGSSTFTTASIPTAEGVSTSVRDRTATLTAAATDPDGGDLTTTFLEADVAHGTGTVQGVVDPAAIAADGSVSADVEIRDPEEIGEIGEPLEARSTSQSPALRTSIPFSEEGQTVLWSGETDPAREIRLLLLDSSTGRFEVVDSARGSADGSIELSASATAAHDSDGEIEVLVLGVDPFADDLENEVRDSFEDPDDYDFSLMHITDTQYLSEGATQQETAEERAEWASAYESSYSWLAEHAEEYKVEFVAHTGDVIESWNTGATDRTVAEEEFAFASETQRLLEDTGIPHAVLPGNHDNLGGGDVGPDSLFDEYFGADRYEALAASESWQEAGAEYHPWQEGDNQNSYTLFTAGGLEFIAVSLGYDVTEEEAAWASDVLDRYPTRNAIVLTHAYNKPSDAADGRGGSFSADGSLILEQVITGHPNVALVLSGHEHGVSISVRRDVGDQGNNIVELLADYQFYEISAEELGLTEAGGYDPEDGLRFGSAYFRLLQFDLDAGEMAVDTYSPYLDDFGASEYDTQGRYDGTEDDTRLPIQLETRTTTFSTDALLGLTPSDRRIGEVDHPSGEAASIRWKHLDQGAAYGWFAVTRTGEGGGVIQFSTFTTGEGGDSSPGKG